MIRDQKWNVILEILQLTCHNPEINQKTGKIKITRYLDKYKKQQRPKQEKFEQQKKNRWKRKKKRDKKRER